MGIRNPLAAINGAGKTGPADSLVDHGLGEAYEVVKFVHDNFELFVQLAGLKPQIEAIAEVADQLGGFAPVMHEHTEYAPVVHNHAGYAPADHDHDEMYQPAGNYAAANHNHDEAYLHADQLGMAGGVAQLGLDGKVSADQLPAFASGADDQTASEVPFSPVAGLTATTVQGAIEEVHSGAENTLAGEAERVRDIVAALLVQGGNITVTVDDENDAIILSVPVGAGMTPYTDEMARDAVMAMIVPGGLLVETENDAGDVDTLSVMEASTPEMHAGAASTKAVTPKKIFDMATTVALVDAVNITIDGDTGVNFSVTLGGNRTLANPVNMKTGQSGLIIITQDGMGSRTLAYGNNWKFIGGAASGGVLSTTANAVDVISYYVRSNGTIIATLGKDFK